jgi:hypothetical protein
VLDLEEDAFAVHPPDGQEANEYMYRKNKNPFHKENRTIEHILGLMGVV